MSKFHLSFEVCVSSHATFGLLSQKIVTGLAFCWDTVTFESVMFPQFNPIYFIFDLAEYIRPY